MNGISEVYVLLIYFQTEKKDAAIQAQVILITAVLTALPSTLERKQHFCVVTICSSHCAQMCRAGELNQLLSHICHPAAIFNTQLGTSILRLPGPKERGRNTALKQGCSAME